MSAQHHPTPNPLRRYPKNLLGMVSRFRTRYATGQTLKNEP